MSGNVLGWSDGQWGDGDVGEFFEPILALRLWALRADILYSTSKAARRWEPRAPLEAECLAPIFKAGSVRCLGRVPRRAKCGCGIYGIKDPGGVALVRNAYDNIVGSQTLVVGVVKLWGLMLEGKFGYRAQFGYPAALAFSEGDDDERFWVERAAKAYGVRLYPPDELPLDRVEKRGVLTRLQDLVS